MKKEGESRNDVLKRVLQQAQEWFENSAKASTSPKPTVRKEGKPTISITQPPKTEPITTIGESLEEIPKEVREWHKHWKKQGSSAYSFTSRCEAMGYTTNQAEEWLKALRWHGNS